MDRMIGSIGCLAVLLAWVGEVRGDLILAFSPDGLTQQFNVKVGDSFNVDLYLIETTTNDLATYGLLGFGTRGEFSSAFIQATGGTVDSSFPFVGGGSNPDFSNEGQVDVFGGALQPPKSPAVHLATLGFTAVGSGTTVIRFGDLDSTFDDFSLNDPSVTSLDRSVFGSTLLQTHDVTINISAVPEPTSFFLTIFAAVSLAARRFRGAARLTKTGGGAAHAS